MNTLETVLLILVIVFTLSIYFLYRLGKSIRNKESELMDMMDERNAKKNLSKYKQKPKYKKAPRINDSYYKVKR